MFAHLFGIPPWEMRRLTAKQYAAFVKYANDLNRED